jgi:hypothetical protein
MPREPGGEGAAWGYGFALGMVVVGGILLADSLSAEFGLPLMAYVSVGVSCIATPPCLKGLVLGGRGVAFTWVEVRDVWRPPAPVQTVQTDDDEPDAPTVDEAREQATLDAMLTFFMAGQKAGGFSSRLLSPGVVGSDTWDNITKFYISVEGRQVLRDAGGNVGTVFNHGHTLDSTIRGLRAGVIPLPPGDKVPEVHPYLPDAAQRSTAPRRTAPKRAEVIDVMPSREA